MPRPGGNSLRFALLGGKNSKALYFAREFLSSLVPPGILRARRDTLLASIARRPDSAEIESRAAYCCKLEPGMAPCPGVPPSELVPPPGFKPFSPDNLGRWRVVGENSPPRHAATYYLDARETLRYFPRDWRYRLIVGDSWWVPHEPTLVKARPIAEGAANANAVLLKLNKVRHFVFVRDRIPFSAKSPTAIFRGKVTDKPKRALLFEKFFGQEGFDLGDTDRHPANPDWVTPKMTIGDQLRHKFILCIEGNDVSSNLKWVMSSNSIAVMPRPQLETWFLEGTLLPGVHYIEVAPDFSDLREKLDWYRARPEACGRIVAAANAHAARFRDPSRERLVQLLVLARYFRALGES